MTLEEKIKTKQSRIGVIGLGYVGLRVALEFAQKGYHVWGIDKDPTRISLLRSGVSYITDVSADSLKQCLSAGRFAPVCGSDSLSDCDVVMICVPTPLNKSRDPDMSAVLEATQDIIRSIHQDMLIILESTTYPGTTEELIAREAEMLGYHPGTDVFICFSPERIDPGNKMEFAHIPKVVGGITPKCTELAALLYAQVSRRVICVSSCRVAEMVKLLENTFRSVNIALVNEMAILCERLEVDVWEVIDAASTKPYGFMPFYPGPGVGGHCIPLDPVYLLWKAKSLGFHSRFIQLATEINSMMPYHVVNLVSESLNTAGKPINGSRILMLGISYKKDVSDTRESPALEIYKMLEARGAVLSYNDPYVPEVPELGVSSTPLTSELLANADCIVLGTDHSCYDYRWIAENAQRIIDTRNAFRDVRSERIVRLGARSSTGVLSSSVLREVAASAGTQSAI